MRAAWEVSSDPARNPFDGTRRAHGRPRRTFARVGRLVPRSRRWYGPLADRVMCWRLRRKLVRGILRGEIVAGAVEERRAYLMVWMTTIVSAERVASAPATPGDAVA